MYIGFVYKGMTAASLVDSLLHIPFGIRGCLYGSRAGPRLARQPGKRDLAE